MRRISLLIPICALLVFLSGCDRNESLRIEAPEIAAPDTSWLSSVADNSGTAGHQAGAVKSEVLTSAESTEVKSDSAAPETFEEIARRIEASSDEWSCYRSEWHSVHQADKIDGKPGEEPQAEEKPVPQASIEEVQAIRREYSASLANARLRVSLLNSRLETADESSQRILEEKLKEAEAELEAVEQACQAEINLCGRGEERKAGESRAVIREPEPLKSRGPSADTEPPAGGIAEEPVEPAHAGDLPNLLLRLRED